MKSIFVVMRAGAGYNTGGVGDGIEQGFSPLDLRLLQEKYIENSESPNTLIQFGEDGSASGLKTDIAYADLQNVLYLYDMSAAFKTPVLGLRSQNLHRSGSTQATPVWCVIPRNQVGVSILKMLHCGATPVIKVYHLAYNAFGAATKPVITGTITFNKCIFTYLSPWGHGDFIVFAFSYTKIKWEEPHYTQGEDSAGGSTKTGSIVYEFDFESSAGQEG